MLEFLKLMNKLIKLFNRTSTQIILISIIVVVSYFNILGNGFSFDDRDFFLDWPTVRNSNSGLSAFLSLPDLLAGELPTHHRGVYRPVRSIYYLFSIQAWGSNPFFYHIQSIVVHLLITIIIYFIAARIALKAKPYGSPRKFIPFITAALFASHPIHTEAVTYTAASFDSLGILFFFASFYFYIRAGSSKDRQETTRFLSLILAFLSFFTYEMTLVLPLLIVFYEICFNKLNLKNFTKRVPVYLPYIIIIAGYAFIRFVLLKIGSRADYLGDAYLPASNQAKLGTLEIIIRYIYLLIWPANLTVTYAVPDFLSPWFFKTVHTMDPTGRLLESIARYIFLFPIFLVILAVGIIIRVFKKQPLIAFGTGWFFISLLPILNILPQGSVMAERFLYIPSFGFCLILALLLYKFTNLPVFKTPDLRMIAGGLLFIAIISIYVTRTIIRNPDWKSLESIFLSAVRVEPNQTMANGALGLTYLEEERYPEAIKLLELAIKADPSLLQSYHQLGLAYEKVGNKEKAVLSYKKALEIEPKYYFANINLGSLYQKQGKYDEAISEFEKALEIAPDNFDARFNLAGAYMHKKDFPRAFEEYLTAQKINPNHAAIYNNLGYINEQTGELNKAIADYKKAIDLDPENYYFHLNLAHAYEKQGLLSLALKEFKKSLTLKPDDKPLQDKISSLERYVNY